jgi:hypothetical protein
VGWPAAGALAVGLVGLGSYHVFAGEQSAVRTPSAGALHEERWDDVAVQVPDGWHLQDARAGMRHYRYGDFVSGPFVATVQTGPICRTTAGGWQCSRADGIVNKPADGVIAWLSAVPLSQGAAADPGDEEARSVCGAAASVFHGYRMLQGSSGAQALTLDGCLYGRRHDEYSRTLRSVLATARLTS